MDRLAVKARTAMKKYRLHGKTIRTQYPSSQRVNPSTSTESGSLSDCELHGCRKGACSIMWKPPMHVA